MSLFGGSQPNASTKTVASGVTINSSIYGKVVPIIYGTTRCAGNLIWYGDFTATPQGGGGGKGGGPGGKSGGSASYTYSAYFANALCEGPVGGVLNQWANKTEYSWAYCTANNIDLKKGVLGQSPWGYLTTKHPGQDLGYSGTAYVYYQPGLFGTSAQMQNLSYEVQGMGNGVYGTPDADPEFVVSDLLTNATYGVGFPPARLGDLSAFSNYCRATGMVVSVLLDTQQDSASTLNDIVQQCNSEFVWSGSLLTIVPYGDQTISANGATYTAPSAPLYSLTDDDFLNTGSSDPVQLTRARPSDRMNAIKLEWANRANQYAAEIVEVKDQAAIETYGLRAAQPKQAHIFTTLPAATMSATLQLQRQAVRNQFTFTLGWKYAVLDPMDIVEITDTALGLNQQWVRILSIEEDDHGSLKVTAEEYLGGTGAAPLYSFQSGIPFIGNYNVPPGTVNTPVIVEPPISFFAGTPQLMIGVSGSSPNWGSCDIYMSTDGSNYEKIGHVAKATAIGVTTSALPVHADPDSFDLLTVDISQSYGATLPAASHATADNYQTGCWICNSDYSNGELVGYGIETLTGTGTYKLSDAGGANIYLRRGQLGTPIAAHASGSMVAFFDQNAFSMYLPPTLIGVTLSFKFVSFNIYGGAAGDLATATAYTFVPSASSTLVGAPSNLSVNVSVGQNADGTIVPIFFANWTASTDPNFSYYEIQWQTHGAGTWDKDAVVGTTSVSFTLPNIIQNTAYDVRIRAVRITNQGIYASGWVEADNTNSSKKTTAPPAPTGGYSLTPGYEQITVNWSALAEPDIAGFDVAYSTTNGVAPPGGSIFINPRPGPQSTSCTITGLATSTPYYVWVRAIDTTGNIGGWTSSLSATTTSVIAPSSCNISTGYDTLGDGTVAPYITITWAASADPVIDHYEVQWQQSGTGAWDHDINVDISATAYKVEPIPTGIGWDARVRAIRTTTQGRSFSAWSTVTNVTSAGKSSAPGIPSSFQAVGILKSVSLSWTNPTDTDFDHVEIYLGTLQDSDPTLASLLTTTKAAHYTFTGYAGQPIPGVWTYPFCAFWLKAVNRSGIKSGFSARAEAFPIQAITGDASANSWTYANVSGGGSQAGSGYGNYYYLGSGFTVTPPINTTIHVNATIVQSGGSSGQWAANLEMNGVAQYTCGGTHGEVTPALAQSYNLSANTSYTFKLRWTGDVSMQVFGSTLQGTTLMK